MAKSQKRSNREAKKPKQNKPKPDKNAPTTMLPKQEPARGKKA